MHGWREFQRFRRHSGSVPFQDSISQQLSVNVCQLTQLHQCVCINAFALTSTNEINDAMPIAELSVEPVRDCPRDLSILLELFTSTFPDTICPGTDIAFAEEYSAINLSKKKLMHLIWQTSIL